MDQGTRTLEVDPHIVGSIYAPIRSTTIPNTNTTTICMQVRSTYILGLRPLSAHLPGTVRLGVGAADGMCHSHAVGILALKVFWRVMFKVDRSKPTTWYPSTRP